MPATGVVRNPDGTYTATYAIAASADDAIVYKFSTAYPPTGTATFVSNGTTIETSKRLASTTRTVVNGLFRWDTADIPADATVTAADLVVNVTSVTNANARSWEGEWFSWSGQTVENMYAVNRTTTAVFAQTLASLAAGSRTIPLSLPTGVSKTGHTEMRTHINGGDPAGVNTILVSSFDGSGANPSLVVTYTLPGQTEHVGAIPV